MADEDSELNDEQSDDETDGEELDDSSQDSNLFGDQEIPPELDVIKKNMQRDYTKKTTRLAEQRRELLEQNADLISKARAYDNLQTNANFQKAIKAAVSEDNDNNSDDEIGDLSAYGENAEQMRGLVTLISNASSKKAVKAIQKMLDPVLTKLNTEGNRGIIPNLQSWVKEQREETGMDYPDPKRYEIEIKEFMDQGFSAEQAYRASIKFSDIKVRKASDTTKKKQSSTFAPGSSSVGNASGKKKYTVDRVMEMKNKGEKMPTIDELIQMAHDGKL
jgi:hypothetical protein